MNTTHISLACLLASIIWLALPGASAAPSAAVTKAYSPFDAADFADPPARYRPLQIVHGFHHMMRQPAELTGEEGIDERLRFLVDLGIGGIVADVGRRQGYLSDERQWEVYRYGMSKAHEMGLELWLYDEWGYPSGTAGGIVVRANPEYAAEGLACYMVQTSGPTDVTQHLPLSCREFVWAGAYPAGSQPTAATIIDLSDRADEWGTLRWSVPEGEWSVLYLARRIMYEGTFATSVPIAHSPTRQHINTLDERAVRAFLRVTHEQYARRTPADVWKNIRAIFTDEPLINYAYTGRHDNREAEPDPRVLDRPFFTDRPPAVPWVYDLTEEFRRVKGYDLRSYLYALFTSDTVEAGYVRQDFWDLVTARYARAYFQQIADWCDENGIALSGHLLAEESLSGNVMFEGSMMAALRPMQKPGVDILTADPAAIGNQVFVAAKIASSVAHLTGRMTVMGEMCAFRPLPSGEPLGFDEFIAQANMLQVMGVNLFTLYQNHHQIGEAAFRRYTEYVGRLSLMLREASHVCDVAVLYPIRSAWSWWAPPGQDPGPDRSLLTPRFTEINDTYLEVSRTLAQGQVDFDMVDEKAIQEAAMFQGTMRVADEAYRVIVLPHPHALELATAEALQRFCAEGGTLISVGTRPRMADSAVNQPAFDRIMADLFAAGGPAHVLPASALRSHIRERHGLDLELDEPNNSIFYTHQRRDGRDLYFLVNNRAESVTLRPRLRVSGPYTIYRPLSGEVAEAGLQPEFCLRQYEGIFLVTSAASPGN